MIGNISIKMKPYTITIALLIFIFHLGCKDSPPETNKLAVSVNSLRLREKPSVNGSISDILNKGDSVEILQVEPGTENINGISGNWVKIRSEWFAEGWVFNAFLSDYSNSALYLLEKTTPNNCISDENKIKIHNEIINKYPKAKIQFTMESEAVYFKDHSQKEIDNIKCFSRRKYFSDLDSGMTFIKEALESKNLASLKDLSDCGIHDMSEFPIQYNAAEIFEIINSDISDYSFPPIIKDDALIYFSKQDNNKCYVYKLGRDICHRDKFYWDLYNRNIQAHAQCQNWFSGNSH